MEGGSIRRAMGAEGRFPSVKAMLIPAIVLITGALLAYTTGVWAERRSGVLKPWHAGFFALGLALDVAGTATMSAIARSGQAAATGAAGVLTGIMQVTGAAALVLMAAHLAWALVVLIRGSERARGRFHRFSTTVWAIWLVPYFTGMVGSMAS